MKITFEVDPIPASSLRGGDVVRFTLDGPQYEVETAMGDTYNGQPAIKVVAWHRYRVRRPSGQVRRVRERHYVYLGPDHTCFRAA
jgi:hypothetical protein